MNANPEFASFARLAESLTPWLDQVVIIGGWAHRLHRLHPFAQPLQYEPLATLDADVALPRRIRVAGDEIYQRLVRSLILLCYKKGDPQIRTTRELSEQNACDGLSKRSNGPGVMPLHAYRANPEGGT
jgi:hypothetical protein